MNAAAAVMATGALIGLALTAGHALTQDTCTPAEGSDETTAEVCVGQGYGATCTPRGGVTYTGDIQIVLEVCDPRADMLARQLRIERARWANEEKVLKARIRELRRRHQPTVDHAIALAAAAYGVDRNAMRRVAWCESTHNPNARNGQYVGLFQTGHRFWAHTPFVAFQRTDPYANALATAQVVARQGWRQWECAYRLGMMR